MLRASDAEATGTAAPRCTVRLGLTRADAARGEGTRCALSALVERKSISGRDDGVGGGNANEGEDNEREDAGGNHGE
jgi:hypothetical protein